VAGEPSGIEDEFAIRRLLAEYCQFLDDGRFDDWIDLFSTEIVFIVMGMHKLGRAEVRGFIEPAQQADARGTHTISAPIIHVEGSTATSIVDFVWLSRGGDVGQIGRYHDTLVRQADRWRFATREIVFAGDQPLETAER
jgi:3-phenylpropionate/cinnamic acid dioxygenase small subunit